MRFLISGNRGYIGMRLVRYLRRNWPEAEIWGLDTGYYEDIATGPESAFSRPHLQYWCDVRSLPANVFRNVDAVVCLAAISNDPMGDAFAGPTHQVNFLSVSKIAAQAWSNNVRRFILASSCSVYGRVEGVVSEDTPVAPLTAYARSKVDAEINLELSADESCQVTCLRFATACGWSERLRLDLVLNAFVASALATGKVTLMSCGLEWRPLIHVDDMARAIDWALQRDGSEYLVVNVGSDRWNYQILSLAQEVARLTGAEVEIADGASGDQRSYRVDFSRFQTLAPIHQPIITLEEAVVGLRDGLLKARFSDPDFRNSKYARLVALQQKQKDGLLDEELYWRRR